jgi:hypothetical protein
MRFTIFSAVVGFGVLASGNLLKNGLTPLKYEHSGQIFHSVSNKASCSSGVLTDGNSTGTFKNVSGGMLFYLHSL